MDKKLVSIIIPTYKGSDALPVALESVRRQNYKNIEVIVSDDNGPNEPEQVLTAKIIDRYSQLMTVKYLINEHVNGSHARNVGLRNAKGDYICFLDDDDFYLADYITSAVDTLENEPTKDIVFFDVTILSREGTCRKVGNDLICAKDILFSRKEIGTGSNLFFRRKIYDETGGFDERYLRFQDFEFITKKMEKYSNIWVNKNLIVKYYNQTDNFLNYQKSLKMQMLYREDSVKNELITSDEALEIKKIQLHNLYKDMLARNMEVQDVRVVYDAIKEGQILTASDRVMFAVYSVSKDVFNVFFKLYIYLAYGAKNVSEKDLIEYRCDLEQSSQEQRGTNEKY